MRINQYLASAGFGSRRKCEKLIHERKVRLNARIVTTLSTTLTESDRIEVEGRVVKLPALEHYLFYKPKGAVCTFSDERGRTSIFNLLPPHIGRLFYVGRLDMESEGLLLLTNDGSLAQRLAHPTHGIEKEYEVVLDRSFDSDFLQKLCRGFFINGGHARAVCAFMLGANKVKIVLRQGIKRQIRLMFAKLGYEVKRLVRVRIGGLTVEGLKSGCWRKLKRRELAMLSTLPSPLRKNCVRPKVLRKKNPSPFGPAGFEPATSASRTQRSTKLSHGP